MDTQKYMLSRHILKIHMDRSLSNQVVIRVVKCARRTQTTVVLGFGKHILVLQLNVEVKSRIKSHRKCRLNISYYTALYLKIRQKAGLS